MPYLKVKDYSNVNVMSYSVESNQIYFLPFSKRYTLERPTLDMQISDPSIPCCTGGQCYDTKEKTN